MGGITPLSPSPSKEEVRGAQAALSSVPGTRQALDSQRLSLALRGGTAPVPSRAPAVNRVRACEGAEWGGGWRDPVQRGAGPGVLGFPSSQAQPSCFPHRPDLHDSGEPSSGPQGFWGQKDTITSHFRCVATSCMSKSPQFRSQERTCASQLPLAHLTPQLLRTPRFPGPEPPTAVPATVPPRSPGPAPCFHRGPRAPESGKGRCIILCSSQVGSPGPRAAWPPAQVMRGLLTPMAFSDRRPPPPPAKTVT